MGHHFFTAITLVHELMHAIQFKSVEDGREYGIRTWPNGWEPYFEDEQFCEVGLSMEKAVFRGQMGTMRSTTERPPQRPHFGYWLKLNWPNFGELNLRLPGSPVLSLDTLPTFSVKIPVEVSVYEKAQQTACWSLLVARYGLKALQGQFPKQGVYDEYQIIPTADDNVDNFRISTTQDRTMVTSVGTPIDITSSAIGFDDLLVMNVREKQAYKTGQKILASSSNSELDFWESSKDLATNIENFDVFVDGREVTTSEVLRVTRYLHPSIKNHLEIIEALLTSEDIFGTVYVERRDNLLRWNAGMRRFMASLMNSFPRDNTLISRVERELPNLDHGRMILAEPNNTPKGLGVQYEEFQAMVDAQNSLERGDILQCYKLCNKHNNYHSSLVVHTCTDIILAQLRTLLGLQARLDALTNGQQILRYLRDGGLKSRWKSGWDKMLDQRMDVCTREGQSIDAELHEQGQQQDVE